VKARQIFLVEDALRSEGEAQKSDLYDRVPAHKKRVEMFLRQLVAMKKAHIVRWEHTDFVGRRYPRPVFKIGPGKNARKPKPMTAAKSAQRYRKRRAKNKFVETRV